jgi:hypothetical protein
MRLAAQLEAAQLEAAQLETAQLETAQPWAGRRPAVHAARPREP